jgi:hypothetical protein
MKLIVVIVFLSFNLYAQESASGPATVYVVRPLSIEAINPNLDFGDIILSGAQFVVSVPPLSGAEFKVIGHPSRNIIITFNSITLNNSQWAGIYGGTNGQIQFTPHVSQENGTDILSGNSYQLSGTLGILNLFLGGSINVSANQPYGDYTGTFTINVSY